jgi:hypothetical protein
MRFLRPAHGRRDELGTDIAFAETAFIDAAIQNWPLPLTGILARNSADGLIICANQLLAGAGFGGQGWTAPMRDRGLGAPLKKSIGRPVYPLIQIRIRMPRSTE